MRDLSDEIRVVCAPHRIWEAFSREAFKAAAQSLSCNIVYWQSGDMDIEEMLRQQKLLDDIHAENFSTPRGSWRFEKFAGKDDENLAEDQREILTGKLISMFGEIYPEDAPKIIVARNFNIKPTHDHDHEFAVINYTIDDADEDSGTGLCPCPHYAPRLAYVHIAPLTQHFSANQDADRNPGRYNIVCKKEEGPEPS